MATALKGWHPGEVLLQRKLGYETAVSDRWQYVESHMREQHRIFHTSNLPFIPVTTLDDVGRPWGSIMTGADGKIGFVKSPDDQTLRMNVRLWDGEPFLSSIKAWTDPNKRKKASPERFLIAGIGIEFPTRRRNKFAGQVQQVNALSDLDFEVSFHVTQALGNCPKYINSRKFVPHPAPTPSVKYRNLHVQDGQRLPGEVISHITSSDTVFVASVYKSELSTAETYRSHAGMNGRGGLPGFVRVSPSDGRTVILPDYSGNRFLSSLGNIECSKLAGLTMISFETGDILYLTGTAEVLVGPPALEIMAKQASVTAIKVTGYVFVRDAFPMRQQPGVAVERSPYSPKIKYLRLEPEALSATSGAHKAILTNAVQYASDIATLRFKISSKPGAPALKIRPGQAIVLDFMDWIGPPVYRHMADESPGSINDDRVRTWTVSSAHENAEATWFELTMREMKGGAVTGALFKELDKCSDNKWGRLLQICNNKISADIVGVTGDFYMAQGDVKMLWIAGGIGVTPFLAMLSALAERGQSGRGDVILALSTREPAVFLQLIKTSLRRPLPEVKIRIDLFTNEVSASTLELDQIGITIIPHKGRIQEEYWMDVGKDRDVMVCGPGGFGDAAVDGLRKAGVPNDKINREGFY